MAGLPGDSSSLHDRMRNLSVWATKRTSDALRTTASAFSVFAVKVRFHLPPQAATGTEFPFDNSSSAPDCSQ